MARILKGIMPIVFLVGLSLCAHGLGKKEIILLDNDNIARAFIDRSDQQTIYLWDGTPVAYIHNNDVYTFNGKHLGWYVFEGIRDHEGLLISLTNSQNTSGIAEEPNKGIKQPKPKKLNRESAPEKPIFSFQWSSRSLFDFLNQGYEP